MITDKVSASSHAFTLYFKWISFDWDKAEKRVYRLQKRIAKATANGKFNKVKALQRILVKSFEARMLAIKKVTSNKGKYTPGVDNIILEKPQDKTKEALSLMKFGYKPSPLKRIYIPKSKGKKRPLSIPTIRDRAMQALYLMALSPIAETYADRDSYGFRQYRSTHDAIQRCYLALSAKNRASWILEADIKSCFDEINHQWIINNIPIDKTILKKWLRSGYIEKGEFNHTKAGTPQGGIISPTICNMVLDGLQNIVSQHSGTKKYVNYIRYADDFIVTGNSPETLISIRKDIEIFLAERGLRLSDSKTKITNIDQGFDFLGFNIRKYKGLYLCKPSKSSIKRFANNIREIIRKHYGRSAIELINNLNPKLKGWANYYKHACSKNTFGYLDHILFEALLKWTKRRSAKQGLRKAVSKYFRNQRGARRWVFSVKVKKGKYKRLHLMLNTPIQRHRMIKIRSNPFMSEWESYFQQRRAIYAYRSKYNKELANELNNSISDMQ